MGTKRCIFIGKKTASLGNSPVLKKSHMAISRTTSQGNVLNVNENNEDKTRKIIEILLPSQDQRLSKNLSTSMPDMSRIVVTNMENEYSPRDRGLTSPTKEDSVKKNFLPKMFRISKNNKHTKKKVIISSPDNLCCVSQIVKSDELPSNVRRIRLTKRDSDPNFGLYIRNGYSNNGSEDVDGRRQGSFVSRFIAGGLAERSGLLSVNDEIIDINYDKVEGLPLNEVYQLMLRNDKEMVLTIKPGDLQTPAT